jgi:hypothetical protein
MGLVTNLEALRRLPALSGRPNFPHDLSILLLESDYKARTEVEKQLRENRWTVTPCSSTFEAAAFLQGKTCDLILSDVRCFQQKSADLKVVMKASVSASGTAAKACLGCRGTAKKTSWHLRAGGQDHSADPHGRGRRASGGHAQHQDGRRGLPGEAALTPEAQELVAASW